MKKKTRQNKDSEYTTAKKLRTQIFKYELMPQADCLVIFTELDLILKEAIEKLFDHEYFFVDVYFRDLILRVISGNTQSKNFYEKHDHEDESKKKTKTLLNSELRFLKTAFNFLRPGITVDQKKEIIWKAKFLRGVMEDAVAFFMDNAAKVKAGDTIHLNSLGNWDVEKVLALHAELLPKWEIYLKRKEQLILPYLRLVYHHAMRSAKSDTQTLNNFQNGYQGLLKAIRQYTPTRFAVFSLVAKSWINQSILINIKNEVNFIKLPVGVWNSYQKLEKVKKELLASFSEEEIVGEEKVKKVKKLYSHVTEEDLAKASGMDIAKVKRTYEAVNLTKVRSLDVPTTNEEEQGYGASWNRDSIESMDNVQERMETENDISVVSSIVSEFPDETRLIFGLSTGCINLVGDPPFTQEELNKEILMQRMAAVNIEVII